MFEVSGNSKLTFDELTYDFFSTKPNATAGAYSAYIDKNVALITEQTPKYIGFTSVGAIERLYLYEKKFDKDEIVTKEVLIENQNSESGTSRKS